MSLQVIGAGLMRTGTLSLKIALDRLGFGPCAHMSEWTKPEYQPRRALWESFYDGNPPAWDAIFAGFRSALDVPTSYFYRRLAAAFPDAKIILTVRDPQSWSRSVREVSGSGRALLAADPQMARLWRKLAAAIVREGEMRPPLPRGPGFETLAIDYVIRHDEAVRRSISGERLLELDVRDGWAPLCAFLDVPVPDEPFPHENRADDLKARHRRLVADATRRSAGPH